MLTIIRRLGGSFVNYSLIRRLVFLAIIIIAVSFVWLFYFFNTAEKRNGTAKVVGTIIYKNSPVYDAVVKIGEEETTTDVYGNFTFPQLAYGKQKLIISKKQFYTQEKNVLIWRKNTSLRKIFMKRDPAFSGALIGVVINNFDKRPIGGAQVEIDGQKTTTNDQGAFDFTDVGTGDQIIKISAIDFWDKEEIVTIANESSRAILEKNKKEIALTPYGKLSFTSMREGKKNIYTINYDGTGLANITGRWGGESWGGHLTPDGKKIVFYSTLENPTATSAKNIALYVADIDGSHEPQRISREILPEGDFAVSRNGQYATFLGRNFGDAMPEIYLVGLYDKSWQKLTDNNIFESDIDISPDGSQIVYAAFADDSRDIFLINTKKYTEKKITSSFDYEALPRFSPDGKNILYVRDGFDFSSRIFSYSLITEKEEEIYKSSVAVDNVAWSKDSERILFSSIRDGQGALFTIGKDSDRENRLTDQPVEYQNIIWPDIQKIVAMTTKSGTGSNLLVMDLSSRKITNISSITDDIVSWGAR
ncbi:PD40 domain-containing protein [Candidatus Microgenomates bacterium]|nr:PD40 domain-containing protein [Candidatus Microgenomates bacterium]